MASASNTGQPSTLPQNGSGGRSGATRPVRRTSLRGGGGRGRKQPTKKSARKSNDMRVIKVCGCCARGYTRSEFSALRLVGIQEVLRGAPLDVRLCGCGSSIAVRIRGRKRCTSEG